MEELNRRHRDDPVSEFALDWSRKILASSKNVLGVEVITATAAYGEGIIGFSQALDILDAKDRLTTDELLLKQACEIQYQDRNHYYRYEKDYS